MTYRLRDQYPGLHHVVARGNNRRDIFETDEDREWFLYFLDVSARKYGWRIYAYALMRNHYHLVLEVGDDGLAGGMCRLNTAYATWFNRMQTRINHLFGRRYWNGRIDTDDRLATVVRYVVQNPRRAGVPGPLESHRWTSYPATMGIGTSRAHLATDLLLRAFGPSPASAKERFRALCETAVPRAPT